MSGEGDSPRVRLLKEPLTRSQGLATSPRKERGEVKNDQPRRGHAAATASTTQLTISSVPPVGAAIGNRLWPAYCRSVRSPENSAGARKKQNAAAIPILR